MSNPPFVSRRAFFTASGLSLVGLAFRPEPDAGLGTGPCAVAGARTVMAGPEEPGERMLVRGRLVAPDGERPAGGAILYAYHTDARGLYNDDRQAAPRLRGFMKTDAEGRFEYETIRPGAYPGRTVPAHVHHQAWGGGWPTQWLADLNFADDPLVGAGVRQESERAGSFAWVLAPRRSGSVLQVELNLRLKPQADSFGANIRHGLSACGLG